MKSVLIILFFISMTGIIFAEGTGTVETECNVKTSCSSNETCWFKLSNLSNAHTGTCTSSYNYSVCCTHTLKANTKTSCSSDEQDLLLFGGDGTINAHAGDLYSPYSSHLCVQMRGDTEMQCAVAQKGRQQPGYDCVVALSNTSNAHSASCMYEPYNYGLYCKARETPYANHTFQITLKSNTLTDTIYIPGIGEKNYATLQSTDYALLSPYLHATSGNTMHALVGYAGTSSLKTKKESDTYSMTLHQKQEPNKAAIIFAKGERQLFQDNVAALQQNNFDTAAVTYFGIQTKERTNVVKQGVVYDKITFRGSTALNPGVYQLSLEHLGTRDKKIVIKVARE